MPEDEARPLLPTPPDNNGQRRPGVLVAISLGVALSGLSIIGLRLGTFGLARRSVVGAPPQLDLATESHRGSRNSRALFFVGSYTMSVEGIESDGHGDGITSLWVEEEAETGSFTAQVAAVVDAGVNPSSLAAHPSGGYLYTGNEGGYSYPGRARAFALDESTGALTELNHQDSTGWNPSSITVSPDGKWVAMGLFLGGGGVSLFPVREGGSLGPESHFWTEGISEGSAVHDVLFDPEDASALYAVDNGLSRVYILDLGDVAGEQPVTIRSTLQLDSSLGPRSLALHPRRPSTLYVSLQSGDGVAILEKRGAGGGGLEGEWEEEDQLQQQQQQQGEEEEEEEEEEGLFLAQVVLFDQDSCSSVAGVRATEDLVMVACRSSTEYTPNGAVQVLPVDPTTGLPSPDTAIVSVDSGGSTPRSLEAFQLPTSTAAISATVGTGTDTTPLGNHGDDQLENDYYGARAALLPGNQDSDTVTGTTVVFTGEAAATAAATAAGTLANVRSPAMVLGAWRL